MSPRTSRQFQEIREEKMTLIMDVALKHFAGEGYFRTTISHIAGHAGISKGLMYNYFESKEELLKAIIHRSVNEIYHLLEPEKGGTISAEEFESLIRKIFRLLRDKKEFWRLLMQLLMQQEVRKFFLQAFSANDTLLHPGHEPGDSIYPSQILQMFTRYFTEKRTRMPETYDPDSDMEMFTATMKGLAMKIIYADDEEETDEKLICRVVEIYK